jgi:hypothetical protein
MEGKIRYRGKDYGVEGIREIKEVIAEHQDKSRRFISQEICRRWSWRQPNGVLKDMICRGLLVRLEAEGLIELPPRKKDPPHLLPRRQRPFVPINQRPITGKLSDLKPLEIIQVRRTALEKFYKELIGQYHYLGYSRPVGEHLEYVAMCDGRPVACSGWSSAPRHIGCRDRYIGWSQKQRQGRLYFLLINTRFLILPWVRVPHLASHLLGRLSRRISQDWQRFYHHEVVWLEAFVDPDRGYKGTCYKAANWIYLGHTTGRGKNDHSKKANRSLKAVFGYPLRRDFREVLCDGLL